MNKILRYEPKSFEDVHFTEYRELSAFDHIKIAISKANVKDWVAYALIAIIVVWVSFCWIKMFDDSYSWRYADMRSWKYKISGFMWGTRYVSLILVVASITIYLINWGLSKSDKK